MPLQQHLACEPECDRHGWRGGSESKPLWSLPPPATPHASSSSSSSSSAHSPFSPALIAIVGILALAFLLVSYYTIFAKYCTARDAAARRSRLPAPLRDDALLPPDAALPILTHGLDAALISAIPVCRYAPGNGLLDVTECAVCLSEFRDNDSLRLLPKCSHAFHLPCIDMWLRSHSTCPLCRANILPPAPPPPLPPPPTNPASGSALPGLQPADRTQESRSPPGDNLPHAQLPAPGTPQERAEAREAPASPTTAADGPPRLLLHMRSFSLGSASNPAHVERMRKQAYLDLRRSFSLGSSRRYLVMELDAEPEWAQASNITDCGSERRAESLRTEEPESACVDSERCASTVTIEIPATGSSSSQVTNGELKLESLQYGLSLQTKVDDLPRAKVLLSLKESLSLKRSFSGSRIFSFMSSRGRDTIVADMSRPPL